MAKSAVVKKNRLLKTLIFILGFLSLLLIGYLVFLPFYPLLKYQSIKFSVENKPSADKTSKKQEDPNSRYLSALKMTAEEVAKSPNRVIIKKIGVDSPIVEAPNSESKTALNKGAWRMP